MLPCRFRPDGPSTLLTRGTALPLASAPINPGVSGAGRSAKEANLYTEVAEGINSYGVTKHRSGQGRGGGGGVGGGSSFRAGLVGGWPDKVGGIWCCGGVCRHMPEVEQGRTGAGLGS